ncbi:hypothetical protein ABN763_15720 [Spongiivirga sp. MCCC 1A20706]|uniref:hypothetical protein n=1 Tax=Spongiivirga sp. MCCC 1A20706 TaxID=3160963 RepID=UPI00397733E4
MKEHQDIGRLIKERFDQNTSIPSKTSWQKIAATLDEKKRKRRGFFILLYSFALIGIGLIYLFIIDRTLPHNVKTTDTLNKDKQFQYQKAVEQNNSTNNSAQQKATTKMNNLNSSRHNNTTTESIISANNFTQQKVFQIKKTSSSKSNTHSNKNIVTKTLKNKSPSIVGTTDIKTNSVADGEVQYTSPPLSTLEKVVDSLNIDQNNSPNKRTKKTKPSKKDEEKTNLIMSTFTFATYFNYLSNKTGFDTSINGGEFRPEISFGYGVLFNIPIKEKIDFRIGLSIQSFRYTIVNTTSTLMQNNREYIFNSSAIDRSGNTASSELFNAVNEGNRFNLQHDFTYWLVPLEINKTIYNKHFEIDLIGGFDIAIIGDNTVYIEAPNLPKFNLGKANYFRDFSLTTNIGLGFRKPITKHLQLALEPMLKYQIGAFQNQLDNLNPYFLTIKAGATYKF